MVLQPQESVKESSGSYAVRTVVGWGVNCPGRPGSEYKHLKRFFVKSSGDNQPKCSLCADIMDSLIDIKEELSVDLQRLMTAVTKTTRPLEDQHYEIGLLIKNPNLMFPKNRVQALQRASYLKKKLQKNDELHSDYKKFVSDMIEQGYCEKVEFPEGLGRTWYLPHHGVYHPEKPGKIRMMFDCLSKFNGVSMNDNLLQGPDLTYRLVGVLLRFRREEVAIQTDIKSIVHQVKFSAKDRDLLRFI